MKSFVNDKKVPLIPPLLNNGKFVTNFLEKANILNNFFNQQWQPISNDVILPLIPTYYIDTRLYDISFNYDKV